MTIAFCPESKHRSEADFSVPFAQLSTSENIPTMEFLAVTGGFLPVY